MRLCKKTDKYQVCNGDAGDNGDDEGDDKGDDGDNGDDDGDDGDSGDDFGDDGDNDDDEGDNGDVQSSKLGEDHQWVPDLSPCARLSSTFTRLLS